MFTYKNFYDAIAYNIKQCVCSSYDTGVRMLIIICGPVQYDSLFFFG
jgi:hypothetical protein